MKNLFSTSKFEFLIEKNQTVHISVSFLSLTQTSEALPNKITEILDHSRYGKSSQSTTEIEYLHSLPVLKLHSIVFF